MAEQEAVDIWVIFGYKYNMAKRTYADRRDYLIKAVAKRRKKIRQMSVEYLGGKCCFCGYDRCFSALDFHHVDESSKEFGLSQNGMTRSWKKTRKELNKCILVCSNCHHEIHAGLLQPSVVIWSGKQGELRETSAGNR